jgi:hypothetical protein
MIMSGAQYGTCDKLKVIVFRVCTTLRRLAMDMSDVDWFLHKDERHRIALSVVKVTACGIRTAWLPERLAAGC